MYARTASPRSCRPVVVTFVRVLSRRPRRASIFESRARRRPCTASNRWESASLLRCSPASWASSRSTSVLVEVMLGGDALATVRDVASTTPLRAHARRSRDARLAPRHRFGATAQRYWHPAQRSRISYRELWLRSPVEQLCGAPCVRATNLGGRSPIGRGRALKTPQVRVRVPPSPQNSRTTAAMRGPAGVRTTAKRPHGASRVPGRRRSRCCDASHLGEIEDRPDGHRTTLNDSAISCECEADELHHEHYCGNERQHVCRESRASEAEHEEQDEQDQRSLPLPDVSKPCCNDCRPCVRSTTRVRCHIDGR